MGGDGGGGRHPHHHHNTAVEWNPEPKPSTQDELPAAAMFVQEWSAAAWPGGLSQAPVHHSKAPFEVPKPTDSKN